MAGLGWACPLKCASVAESFSNERYFNDEGSTTMHIIYFLLIGLCAGWLAGQLFRGIGFGLLGDMVVGCIGAFVGGFVFGLLGIATGGLLGALLSATVGALLLLFLLSLLRRKGVVK
jgi:uncharacterized membrane protein YeaQ/YmgE (transglycosylase-associated protein family)